MKSYVVIIITIYCVCMHVSIHVCACVVCACVLVLVCMYPHRSPRTTWSVLLYHSLLYEMESLTELEGRWWPGNPSDFPAFTPNSTEGTGTSTATPGFSLGAGKRAQNLMLAKEAFLPPSHLSESPCVSTDFFFFVV